MIIILIIQTILLAVILFLLVNKNSPTSSKPSKDRKALLDSCALIDGRIVELAQAGFVPNNLEVPQFIISELQLLADGSDSQKRERARYGLEVIQRLQQLNGTTVHIDPDPISDQKLTDDKLVSLAQKVNADLYTTDFNLNQVASIKGVRVLNVNELAHALRPVVLPGEVVPLKIIQTGSSKDQGVGYLEDGTMVVVDGAKNAVGKTINIQITRSHQTVAGRMLFGNVIKPHGQKPGRKQLSNHHKENSQPQKRQSAKPGPKEKLTPAERKLFNTVNNSNN
jgi:uncharacterized protein YacL